MSTRLPFTKHERRRHRNAAYLPKRTLPFAPLEALALGRMGDQTENQAETTTSRMARVLGVDYAAVPRFREKGIGILSADQAAVRLGMHPLEIWSLDEWAGDVLDMDAHLEAVVAERQDRNVRTLVAAE